MAVSPWNIRLPCRVFRLFGRLWVTFAWKNHKKPGFPSDAHLSIALGLVNAFLEAISLCVSMACSELQSLSEQLFPKLCFVSFFETTECWELGKSPDPQNLPPMLRRNT
jgi:hypothetical protein